MRKLSKLRNMTSILNSNLALVLSESEACVLVALLNYSICTGCALMAILRNGSIFSFSLCKFIFKHVLSTYSYSAIFCSTFYYTDTLSPCLLQIREYASFFSPYPSIAYLTQLNIC